MARALVDQGAQGSFISEYLCKALQLERRKINVPISGVGSKSGTCCQHMVEFKINSNYSDLPCYVVKAFVLPKITSYKPISDENMLRLPYIQGVKLADPRFYMAGTIDLLLGAEVHALIVKEGIRRGESTEPLATSTTLGWLMSGCNNTKGTKSTLAVALHNYEDDLASLLQKFWEIESLPKDSKMLTQAEQECEEYFLSTFSRSKEGKYIVRLAFKEGLNLSQVILGDTHTQALRMLNSTERRFARNPILKQGYVDTFKEYLSMGHMVEVEEGAINWKNSCFLTHHGVVRESSTSTKFRIVFNASDKSLDKGISLNDLLHVGQNLYPDLIDLILRWRLFPIAFSADIEKMFRQLILHKTDQRMQYILWRFDVSDPVKIYRLTYPCFGLVISPFLASRVICQLRNEYKDCFPKAAEVLNYIYMDNVQYGAYNLEGAKQIRDELIAVLDKGKFPLTKWMSNNLDLLKDLPSDYIDKLGDEGTISVLGLMWKPTEDLLFFKVEREEGMGIITKRNVLSRISKIFDPMGWLAPVVISAKIFIQSLWLLKLDWDQQLPKKQARFWIQWYDSIGKLSDLRIPRWINYLPNLKYELHGFADASSNAYGAVMYIRVFKEGESSNISMLVAKTRVAPIHTLTIPKLELCAAELLAELACHCVRVLKIPDIPIFLWSDSQDVLYWLEAHPSRWKVFVANRCSKIHSWMPQAFWRHVSSQDNPADLASRGISVEDFLKSSLWFNGPGWLATFKDKFPGIRVAPNPSSGRCTEKAVLLVGLEVSRMDTGVWNLLHRYSDWIKLLRVSSYCINFIVNCIERTMILINPLILACKQTSLVDSMERTMQLWLFLVQRVVFKKELKLLKSGGTLPINDPIAKLLPEVDENGLLRVGGRLNNALLERDFKNPYILPSDSYFTTLLVRFYHRKSLHGGVQLTLTSLRRKFWIVRGRQVVKSIIHKCTACIRYRASAAYQIMGDLPYFRVRPANVFQFTGVDYAGPIQIRPSKGRGRTSIKGYIAVFICLTTKAVHLELVSSYASAEFLAAFDRFSSRRGHCQTMFSDQGTTFVGADSELRSLFTKTTAFSKSIVSHLSSEGTEWKFNAPGAPHHGGIWESAVKSAKHHIRRVIGDNKLTFEEMQTLLCKVEACMNSRPLVKLSDDPSDPQPLTPAHFLIGRESFIVPHPRITEEKIPVTKRWRLITQMNQHFWDRWSAEYLQSLQSRNKWIQPGHVFKENDIVLIKNELTPPSKWPLGRIIKLHPGKDDLVRIVTIKTATSQFQRPIVKIIPLLVSEDIS